MLAAYEDGFAMLSEKAPVGAKLREVQRLSLVRGKVVADRLAVFTGPHTYVSATWYTKPVGSTWNYMSVHAYGTIRFGDTDELRSILPLLFIMNGNAASTTVFDNLPAEYTERMMKAIVPFVIEVNDLQHVFKLSQDRDKKSYENIIMQLEKQDAAGKYIA